MTLEQCIADYERIVFSAKLMKETEAYKYNAQILEWLRELKAYRGLLANADRLIESEYGVIIIEGYKDVLDQMNEVYKERKDGK